MTTKQSGEPFEGRSAEMKKDSPWLASEDLMGFDGDVEVEIEQCYRHRDVIFDEGRKESVIYTLKFKGKTKQMVLNNTNRKALVRHFGVNVKDWVGKKIKLYVDPQVRFGKEIVCGIRIR